MDIIPCPKMIPFRSPVLKNPVTVNFQHAVSHLPENEQAAKIKQLESTLTYEGAVNALNMIAYCQEHRDLIGISQNEAKSVNALGNSLISLIESMEFEFHE